MDKPENTLRRMVVHAAHPADHGAEGVAMNRVRAYKQYLGN